MSLNNINVLISIAKEAGAIVMKYYVNNTLDVNFKANQTPVTNADIEADQFIRQKLTEFFPFIDVVSEENANDNFTNNSIFWLVDPLDGTKSFIKKDENFTINIALIKDGSAFLGVIYKPITQELYYNLDGVRSYKIYKHQTVMLSSNNQDIAIPRVIIGSHTSLKELHLQNFLNRNICDPNIIQVSSSIKFCMMAEGKAELYPRFGETSEWDTAAGHAILKGSGGNIIDLNGIELSYSKPYFLNEGFIAYKGNFSSFGHIL